MINVLLIDDDANEHKILKAFTNLRFKSQAKREDKCVFDGVYTIEEAVEALRHKKYDYIFLDDRLKPHASALQTLPQIQDNIKDAKIYVISACTYSDHLQDHEKLGVDAVISKFDLGDEIREGLLTA